MQDFFAKLFDSSLNNKRNLPQMPNGLISNAVYRNRDFTNRYNTPIPDNKRGLFGALITKLPIEQRSSYDYDISGALLDGLNNNSSNGHFPDKFKKPNHPTFSEQSIYNGVNGMTGGSWSEINGKSVFKPSTTNLAMYSPEELRKYFHDVEGNDAVLLYDLKDILRAFPQFNKD